MTCDDEWIVECFLMRMRSSKLYEHLRKQSIMILPGPGCLQRCLQRFKGGFGRNPKVFVALSEKTKSMDAFSFHGGLLVDEIKLSEHVNMKATAIQATLKVSRILVITRPVTTRVCLQTTGWLCCFNPALGSGRKSFALLLRKAM